MQINGSWVDVMVDMNSLREALELAFHNVINAGAHHEHAHNETVGADIEYIDHGALPPAQPQHPPLTQLLQPL